MRFHTSGFNNEAAGTCSKGGGPTWKRHGDVLCGDKRQVGWFVQTFESTVIQSICIN